jgi:AcrR family transcriptional regulator
MTDTREYIIDEAFKLFLNHSYEAVSISIISETIGLTKGALYHHFENKEELFRAVINKHFNIPVASVDADNITLKEYTEECVKQTQRILKTLFSGDEKFMPINYVSLIADCFRHYKGFTEEKFGFVEQEVGVVKKILDNAISRGEIRNDIDTNIVAMQFFSLSIGMAGDIVRNSSIDSTINSMKLQLNQLYNLLKV